MRTFFLGVICLIFVCPAVSASNTLLQNDQQIFNIPEGDVTALIDALLDANDNPGQPALIRISGTYDLSPSADERIPFAHVTGPPIITSEITIEAAGNGSATIRRDPELGCELDGTTSDEKFRIFRISEQGVLTLIGITISHGCADSILAASRRGGGILNEGTLTIIDGEIINNSANNHSGGIWLRENAVLEVFESTISENSAGGDGGGIASRFDVVEVNIVNSEISDNVSGGSGGGIQMRGILTINGSILSGNTTNTTGGGVRLSHGIFIMNNSTVTGNSAGSQGGGIATNGGEIVDSQILSNTTESSGGGIYNSDSLLISNSTIMENSADTWGGGVYNSNGTIEIKDSDISGNNSNSWGGGIKNGNGIIELINSEVSGNTSGSQGGGVYSRLGSTLKVVDSEISGNVSENGGGGIFNHSASTVEIIESTVSNNASESFGGGINNAGAMSVYHSIIAENLANENDGGGIFTNSSESNNISNTTIEGNFAEGFGGGIANRDSLFVTGSTFTDNNSESGGGGINNAGVLTVINSTFWNNVSSEGGGVLNHNGGELNMSSSSIALNSATHNGGGISNQDGSVLYIKNSIVAGSPSGGDCHIDNDFNAIGENISSDESCPGFTLVNTDPQLDPDGLQDHGGSTKTIALLPDSPAIDAAEECTDVDGNPVETDQRGVIRPQGEHCDIGSFELSDEDLVPTPDDFVLDIIVADEFDVSQTLTIGTAPDATTGFDEQYDQFAPPEPPAGVFDARIRHDDEDYLRFFQPTTTVSTTWNVRFQYSEGGEPITLSWSPSDFENIEGEFRMLDTFGGDLINVDMREESSYTVENTAINQVNIVHTLDSIVDISFASGWNMLGLPVQIENTYYLDVFPSAVENSLWGYLDGYYNTDEFEIGEGYWLRFHEQGETTLSGTPIDELEIPLDGDWNMISAISCVVSIDDVDDPEGIIIPGTLFGFDDVYVEAEAIEPGNGYWIRTGGEGVIVLSCNDTTTQGIVAKSSSISDGYSFNVLTFINSRGGMRDLYFGGVLSEDAVRESYSLPPLPPQGAFDVRFTDDRYLTEGTEYDIRIQASDEHFPLTVAFDPVDEHTYVITEYRDNEPVGEHILDGIKEIELINSDIDHIRLREYGGEVQDIPVKFSLSQNYPNPFNPATTIRFALPEAGEVQLTVYDILGRKIETLVDGYKDAGYYERVFDAGQLSSGVYLYQLRAGEFVETKRFMLVK